MRYPTASFSVFEYDAAALYTLLCMDSSVVGKQTSPSYSLKICWFLEDGCIFGLLLSRAVAGLRPQLLLLPCPGCAGLPSPLKRLPCLAWAHLNPRPGLGDRWWTRMRRPPPRCCGVAVSGLRCSEPSQRQGTAANGKTSKKDSSLPDQRAGESVRFVLRGAGERWQGDPGLGRQSQLDALDGSAERFHPCSWLDISA